MTNNPPSPIVREPTRMTVSSGFISGEASLKGWVTGIARATPGSLSKASGSSGPGFPVTPIAVR